MHSEGEWSSYPLTPGPLSLSYYTQNQSTTEPEKYISVISPTITPMVWKVFGSIKVYFVPTLSGISF